MRLYFNDGSKSKVFHSINFEKILDIYTYENKILDIRNTDSRDPKGVGKVAVTVGNPREKCIIYVSKEPAIAKYKGNSR